MNNHAKAEDRTKAVMNANIDKICLLVIAKSIMTQIRGKGKIFFKENVKLAKFFAKVIFNATADQGLTKCFMGQYFYIVNPNKKQYISAGTFDENNKASGVFYGLHGNAVALLVCKIDEVRRTKTALEGSWFGDEIYVVGDDHGKPDAYGIKTSTSEKPWRNLYLLADEEYENVSLKAIAMMCEWSDYWLEEFVQRIKERRSLGDEVLIVLGNVVFTIGCEPLEEELEKQFGKNWIEKYKEAWLNYGISPLSVSEQWKYTPDSIKDWLKKKRR